jgi:hypothetical protein
MKIWKLLSFDLWQSILTNGRTSAKGFCKKGMGLVNNPHLKRISNKDWMMKMHKVTMRGVHLTYQHSSFLVKVKDFGLKGKFKWHFKVWQSFWEKNVRFHHWNLGIHIWWPALILPHSLTGFENKLWNN